MSWVKITGSTKRLLAPDCLSWIFPTELYTNGKNEFLYLHEEMYYIEAANVGREVLFTTNSNDLETIYSGLEDGDKIYGSVIPNATKVSFVAFDYKGTPALKTSNDIVMFKEDGIYRLRSIHDCVGASYLKKLYATYSWEMEVYNEQFTPETYNYSQVEEGEYRYFNYKYTHTNSSRDSWPIRKSSVLFSSWAVDKADGVNNPPLTWKNLRLEPDVSSRLFREAYVGLAQFEHEISTSLVSTHLYSSNTLLGEYTAKDEEDKDIIRTVGWLKFTDTLDYVYIKNDTLYSNNGLWYVRGKQLSNEPTVDNSATYTVKDEDGGDLLVTVSFDSYVSKKETTMVFTSIATKADIL